MKKILTGIVISSVAAAMTAVAFSLAMSAPAFAAQWKSNEHGWWYENDDGSYVTSNWQEISGKWYYFYADGYMAANTWIGNYYVGTDGAMLTDTATPDGYRVDENGAWIPENNNSRPKAPYYDVLSNPLFYGGASDYLGENGIFITWGKQSELADCGSYYTLGSQELWFYKTYNTAKEARQSQYYRKAYGGGHVETLSNGKYVVCDSLGDYETVTAYNGPIYIDKNTVVSYYDYTDSSPCTLDEYWPRSGSIIGTNPGEIRARITQIDENGYVTFIELLQAG